MTEKHTHPFTENSQELADAILTCISDKMESHKLEPGQEFNLIISSLCFVLMHLRNQLIYPKDFDSLIEFMSQKSYGSSE